MHPSFERNRRFWSLNHVKPWVGQFRATTANPRGLMRKCGFGRFWRWKLKTHLWFQRFRKIFVVFWKNAGISRVFKGWIRRRICNVDAVLQGRLHYLYVETSVWKSKGMHPCFERNSRFWCLNHVVLSLFRRTYVESLSLHFLKEKECVFASFREIISICSEKVQKFEVKKVFSIFAKIKI